MRGIYAAHWINQHFVDNDWAGQQTQDQPFVGKALAMPLSVVLPTIAYRSKKGPVLPLNIVLPTIAYRSQKDPSCHRALYCLRLLTDQRTARPRHCFTGIQSIQCIWSRGKEEVPDIHALLSHKC